MFCSKTNSKTKLEDCAVSWSGDSISICSKCRMSIWDINFNDFHVEEVNECSEFNNCEQCGENAWDGRICHSCGLKHI